MAISAQDYAAATSNGLQQNPAVQAADATQNQASVLPILLERAEKMYSQNKEAFTNDQLRNMNDVSMRIRGRAFAGLSEGGNFGAHAAGFASGLLLDLPEWAGLLGNYDDDPLKERAFRQGSSVGEIAGFVVPGLAAAKALKGTSLLAGAGAQAGIGFAQGVGDSQEGGASFRRGVVSGAIESAFPLSKGGYQKGKALWQSRGALKGVDKMHEAMKAAGGAGVAGTASVAAPALAPAAAGNVATTAVRKAGVAKTGFKPSAKSVAEAKEVASTEGRSVLSETRLRNPDKLAREEAMIAGIEADVAVGTRVNAPMLNEFFRTYKGLDGVKKKKVLDRMVDEAGDYKTGEAHNIILEVANHSKNKRLQSLARIEQAALEADAAAKQRAADLRARTLGRNRGNMPHMVKEEVAFHTRPDPAGPTLMDSHPGVPGNDFLMPSVDDDIAIRAGINFPHGDLGF